MGLEALARLVKMTGASESEVVEQLLRLTEPATAACMIERGKAEDEQLVDAWRRAGRCGCP